MATSLNGWPALQYGDSHLATGKVPGTSPARYITANREALPLLLHFAAAWHRRMPQRLKLNQPNCPVDSHEYREARSASGFSNHASGTAIDLCYQILLADRQRHMTDEERSTLSKILSHYVTADGHHVLANGAWWSAGYTDEMHTELSQNWDRGAKRDTTLADVQAVIKRLGIKPDGTTTVIRKIFPPKPAPAPVPAPTGTKTTTVSVAKVQPGKTNSQVGLVQKALKAQGIDPGPIDGAFGPQTRAAYSQWQHRLGFSGKDADGKPGIKSLTALGNRYHFLVIA